MNITWIEHKGAPVTIDPDLGYEAIRGELRSLIVMHEPRRQPLIVKVRRAGLGQSIAPDNSCLWVSGFLNDYYIVYV